MHDATSQRAVLFDFQATFLGWYDLNKDALPGLPSEQEIENRMKEW